jgi:hypothetical protein
MMDESRLIHANSHAMAVAIEPLADVAERMRAAYGEGITARRRLTP